MEELVQKAKEGDESAFISLIEGIKKDLYRIAKGILRNDEDVADAIQETILSAYKGISKLKQEKYFKTWIIRILINKCKDIIKSNKKYIPIEKYYGDMKYVIEKELEDEDIFDKERLLQRLSEKYRTVLYLYYGEGFNITEIANILNTNENTVKTRMKRGKEQLKRIWKE